MSARPEIYLRSYPIPEGMQAHASAVEEDGWDGLLFTDTQNLSMDVFGSLYLAASATSRLRLGTAAGLDPEAIDIGAFVVVGAGTDQRSLDELVRGNASISAHFQRDVTSSLSPSDATVVEEVTSHYDYYHHGLEHASQAKVIPADFLSRFCVIGSPDECTQRLRQLVDPGLSHLVIVGGSRDIDATVRERSDHLVAREVLPALQAIG